MAAILIALCVGLEWNAYAAKEDCEGFFHTVKHWVTSPPDIKWDDELGQCTCSSYLADDFDPLERWKVDSCIGKSLLETALREKRKGGVPIFGSEFTFLPIDTSKYAKRRLIEKLRQSWVDQMTTVCKGRSEGGEHPVCTVLGTYVIFGDGFWFRINEDFPVLETQVQPLTLQDLIKYQSRVQNEIFDFAEKNLEAKPSFARGGGHIHIDLSAFKNDPILFMNFLTDFQNFTWAHGALGNGTQEKLLALGDESDDRSRREKFAKIVDWVAHPDTELTIQAIAARILHEVQGRDWNFAVNVRTAVPERDSVAKGSIEIRFPPAQRNAEQFTLLAKLFQARIESLSRVLKEKREQIAKATANMSPSEKEKYLERHLELRETIQYEMPVIVDPTKIDKEKAKKNFLKYIESSSLDSKEYMPCFFKPGRAIDAIEEDTKAALKVIQDVSKVIKQEGPKGCADAH